MNEFSVKPPEGQVWSLEVVTDLVNFIQCIKNYSDASPIYNKNYFLKLMSRIDIDFAKTLVRLNIDSKFKGLVHIYHNSTCEIPIATILSRKVPLAIIRNV